MKRFYPAVALLLVWSWACADMPMTGSNVKAQSWNEMYPERIEVLRLKGDVGRGAEAFVICQGCHRIGARGRPDGSYPRLAGQHTAVIIKQITDVQTGRRHNPKMLPFADQHVITSQDIADIAVFLRGLPVTTDQGQGSGDKLKQGKALYVKDCALCHGQGGQGDGEMLYPRVSGQHYRYLLRESRMIRDGKRHNAHPERVSVIRRYTEFDLAAVADFMSHLPVETAERTP